ncbi:glycosyl transferase [Paenibacillus terrae]|uniref:Glycosyl transferase n=1 Tax=Paenibacillus terrae TaxID=159743 RepID=A0A4U2Q798_9BACL|nr:glycoside hydrolase family 99-like domain-containing protein [Paenibacillus terrae]TKH45924.1 glycosyl transferase [Paenibacillus terrae]
MKVIAFYLPQYHRIPENDRWWGDGFTEWTNVRRATPLYPGHNQPQIPYQERYYDLTQKKSQIWQAELAKSYGIYGFCYYHYWFKGKLLLETPLQQVLASNHPDLPFCLSWANEPWTRIWDGGENEKNILMPQEYGDEEDWREHFQYLLKIFSDSRYILIKDKPVFLIYRPENIPRCREMLVLWNKLARENGLPGIYFVQTLGGFPIEKQAGFDASVEFEPHYTFAHGGDWRIWNYLRIKDQQHLTFDYDYVWSLILNRSHRREGEPIFTGAFVDWDNTPRRQIDGVSCIGAAPHKFEWYLTRQLERTERLYQSEFLFINAWNEWGEGAYLEPDTRHGHAYLQAVRNALDARKRAELTTAGFQEQESSLKHQ